MNVRHRFYGWTVVDLLLPLTFALPTSAMPREQPFSRGSSMGAFGHQLPLTEIDTLTASDGSQTLLATDRTAAFDPEVDVITGLSAARNFLRSGELQLGCIEATALG
jgi:hypothetical protein